MGINYQNLKKFFSTEVPITCLHADFILGISLSISDLYLVNRGNEFNIYFNKNKEIICGRVGFELFKNKIKFNKFMKEFKDYIDFANGVVIPRYKNVPQNLTKEEFVETTKFLGKFWYYYGFTEFPFMDYAYSKSVNNIILKNNLNDLSVYKFKAREVLNSYFFQSGVINNILEYISNKYLRSNEAKYLYLDELKNVFEKNILPKKIIRERKKCYGSTIINNKITRLSYNDALELYANITKFDSTEEVRGLSANKGLAKGRAIIAPMLNDKKDIARINKKMKKGDILIAETTSPDILMLCKKAKAIVAEQGGILSHAAVISREMGIPCIIQATHATKIIKNNEIVEIDANNGVIKIKNYLK